MDDLDEKINNTINVVYSVLEKNKDNEDIQEPLEDIKKLKEKRNI